MIKWFLVEVKKDAMPRWCQIVTRREPVVGGKDQVETVWMDGRGISHEQNNKQRIFVVVEADRDWELVTSHKAATIEFPFATKYLHNPDSESGWVAPDGKFWGCITANSHEWLMQSLLRRSVHEISQEGWVRMCGSYLFYGNDMEGPNRERYARKPLTQPQIDTLFDLGFSDISTSPWPHTRIWKGSRVEADKSRFFAVRQHEARAMMDQIIRTRCKPMEVEAKPASGPSMN